MRKNTILFLLLICSNTVANRLEDLAVDLTIHIIEKNFIKAQSDIQNGADPNYQPTRKLKSTPLAAALWTTDPSETQYLKLLIENGADVNIPQMVNFDITTDQAPQEGISPLFFAVAKGNYEKKLNILLEAGADPNVTYQGNTPLRWAIKHKAIKLIKPLLKAGARTTNADHTLAQQLNLPTEIQNLLMPTLQKESVRKIVEDIKSGRIQLEDITRTLPLQLVELVKESLAQ
jgi:ankyrin repeat protein